MLEELVVEAVKRPLRGGRRSGGEGGRARARAGARPRQRRRSSSSAAPRRGRRCRRSSTPTRSSSSSRETGPRRASSRRTRASSAGSLGRDSKEIAAHRLAAVREAAEKFDAVVVLKGEDSLVAAPGGGVLVCALGLPSLATAGTGDVLTGITAAFLAKGMEPQRAAAAACAAQQLASRAAEQRAVSSRATSSRRCRQFSTAVAGRRARSSWRSASSEPAVCSTQPHASSSTQRKTATQPSQLTPVSYDEADWAAGADGAVMDQGDCSEREECKREEYDLGVIPGLSNHRRRRWSVRRIAVASSNSSCRKGDWIAKRLLLFKTSPRVATFGATSNERRASAASTGASRTRKRLSGIVRNRPTPKTRRTAAPANPSGAP